MSNPEESRREFLVRAAVGAGAAATAAIVPDALAQNRQQHTETSASDQHMNAERIGAFFNEDDSATIASLTERLMPSAPGMPGARDAGVLNYIDLALSGAYADLQDFYRRGLAQLDAHCRESYSKSFRELSAAQQDEVIAALEKDAVANFTWPRAQQFFSTLRTHTMEGMFADPIYGGNKDFAGWRLVGFPGAQAIYSPVDMKSKQAFAREPIIGLQERSKDPVRSS